jgi:hypothetical protein
LNRKSFLFSGGGILHPGSFFALPVATFDTPFPFVTSKNCWWNEVWMPTTRPCGVASRAAHRNSLSKLDPICETTNNSWRVDETYVRIKRRWFYLYRATDSAGATIRFFLLPIRSADAAKQLFSKALPGSSRPQPRVINTHKAEC